MHPTQLEEIEQLKAALRDSDNYKEKTKPYKRGIQDRDERKISVVVETIQKIIVEKQRESPMVQLNAIRLAKECFDYFVPEYMEMIGEKVLPIMSQIAHFQMSNHRIDRGKDYFLGIAEKSGGPQDVQVVECLYVWAKWLPLTQFALTYQNLVEQKIQFPTSFSYFKPDSLSSIEEIMQRRKELAQNKTNKKDGKQADEENKDSKNSRIQSHEGLIGMESRIDQESKIRSSSNQNEFRETQTGGNPEIPIKAQGQGAVKQEVFSLVTVNNALSQIQQIKNTLLEGLSKARDMEKKLLLYFREEFQKFIVSAQDMSSRLLDENLDGAEDIFGILFNENEFSELFVKHCDSFLANQISWTDLQKPFLAYMKKPVIGNKYGDTSQTIGEYVSIRMQPNMLASDMRAEPTIIEPKKFNNNHHNTGENEDYPEETIKRNSEFTAENQAISHPSQQIKGNLNNQILTTHNPLPSQQKKEIENHQKEQYESEKRQQDGNKRTLKEAISQEDVSKYKFELKSKTNFSKISSQQNQSNLTQLNQFSPNKNQDQNQNNQIQQLPNQQELVNKLKEVLENIKYVTQERDQYKQKYDQAQVQLSELKQRLTSNSGVNHKN